MQQSFSNILVHPNVDKKSFIRWKQRDIHDKREQLKYNMLRLESNNETNTELIARVKRLLAAAEQDPAKYFADVDLSVKTARGDSTKEHPALNPQAPPYMVMIESLVEQIVTKATDAPSKDRNAVFVAEIKEHLAKLEKMLADDTEEYNKLVEERSRHILSEDIHTGFDSTLINKSAAHAAPQPSSSASSSGTKTVQTTEVLNPGTVAKPVATEEDPDDVKASPDALKFGEIKAGDYNAARQYMVDHPWIVTEKEKDGLVMEAFQRQLDGKTAEMERIVHNALLIQYCATLGADGINMFFSRIGQQTHPANAAFLKDVKFTVDHIKERCKILQASKGAEEKDVEQIQLYSVDPNTEITVNVPPEDSEDPAIQEARRMFEQLDVRLREAAATKSLDEINKVLADMSVPEAEEAVKHLDLAGVLSVEEKIYDATQWQEEKREKLAKGEFSEDLLREAEAQKAAAASEEVSEESSVKPAVEPEVHSTIDEVD